MSTLVTLILAIFAATASKVLADEFKEWNPWIVNRLIRFSIQRIPEVRRKQLEDQWRNRVANRPGFIAKLIDALTCVAAFNGVGQSQPMTLIPLYKVIHERYAVYWKIDRRSA